jgi:ribosomal protein S27AE
MKLLTNAREPLFATAEQVTQRPIGRVVLYFDHEGMPACINVQVNDNAKICTTCGNACIMFAVNEDLTYTCSACGKFPPELLVRN